MIETMRALLVGFAAITLISGLVEPARAATPVYGYRVVHVYPHDRQAFTQGLEYRDGLLYEGTGLNGRSSLRKVELSSGKILQERPLDGKYFGEGITVTKRRIFQLTWQSHEGFIYDRFTLVRKGSFSYTGEGWGLTNDGRQIFMSDGTSEIRRWNVTSLKEINRLKVHDGAEKLNWLNELEYVKGEIYGNVWQTDRIARISPRDGQVIGWIDLSGLLSAAERADGADVLNGIAYDPTRDRLFVTGKLWPKLFEIQVVSESQPKDQVQIAPGDRRSHSSDIERQLIARVQRR